MVARVQNFRIKRLNRPRVCEMIRMVRAIFECHLENSLEEFKRSESFEVKASTIQTVCGTLRLERFFIFARLVQII